MRWFDKVNENIKKGIRSWLNIMPSSPYNIQINEILDFEMNAIRNRIWYRGDGNEIEQLYQSINEYADKYKFWASKCTPGMEIRKIHTGLPGLIVRTLASIVLEDMNDFKFEKDAHKQLWKEIEEDNGFRKKLEKNLKEVLYIGDGAYKVTINTKISQYPILQWYPGERIELVYEYDRLKEIIYKTPYIENKKQYILYEYYGKGYINYALYHDNKEIELSSIKATEGLKNTTFEGDFIHGVVVKVYENAKFDCRGGSIFDGKLDSFDSFDEVWSQWMDALRAGRARTFIPESYIPRNPNTGELIKPNPFDNRFIAGEDNYSENGKNVISTEQPAIPYDSYLSSYITALDLCLQGIISPSTLGIDVKKLDNAEAQREKEKATLYSRNAIVEALQETLPEVVRVCINAYNILNKKGVEDVTVSIPFGEYANPSFESQIETLSKARPGVCIMSVEAQVEELYGDSQDDEWKKGEIARLKAEQGIVEISEPSINTEGVNIIESNDNEKNLPDVSKGISGVTKDSK